MGTPAYMAPEQAKGQSKFVGPAADVWALGVIIYECLTGRRPFEAEQTFALLREITEVEPPAVRALVPAVPRDLELIVQKCLAKNPADRYATAGELADELRRFLGGESLKVRAAGVLGRFAAWTRGQWVYGTIAVLTVALLVGLGVGVRQLWQRVETARADAVQAHDAATDVATTAVRERAAFAAETERFEAVLSGMLSEQEDLARWNVALSARSADLAREQNRLAAEDERLKAAGRLLIRNREELARERAALARGWLPTDLRERVRAAEVVVIQPEFSAPKDHLHFPNRRRRAAFSADGRHIVTTLPAGPRVYEAATGLMVVKQNGQSVQDADVMFNSDGQLVVTMLYYEVKVWNSTTGAEVAAFKEHTKFINAASLSPAGRWVASVDDAQAWIWDVRTGKAQQSLRVTNCVSISFSPDGRRLMALSREAHRTRIWDTSTWASVSVSAGLRSIGEDNHMLAISPDWGHVIAERWNECNLRIFKVDRGEVVAILSGHHDEIASAVFSPDGRHVVTASRDGTARIWDATTGAEVVVLRGHLSGVTYAEFSPDGKRVLTTSRDGSVVIWDLAAAIRRSPSRELAPLPRPVN